MLCDSYGSDYDPYPRPESHLGYAMEGQAVDEYGRPLDVYDPRDHYGRPTLPEYYNGNVEDEYDYGYGYQGNR